MQTRRSYSAEQISEALRLIYLEELPVPMVSTKMQIPYWTLVSWKRRFAASGPDRILLQKKAKAELIEIVIATRRKIADHLKICPGMKGGHNA